MAAVDGRHSMHSPTPCDRCYAISLRKQAFDKLPPQPAALRQAGRVVHLVCHARGKVRRVHHLAAIRALRSFRALDVYSAFSEGNEVEPTIDIRSDAGWIHLSHTHAAVVDEDYKAVVAYMLSMFEVEQEGE